MNMLQNKMEVSEISFNQINLEFLWLEEISVIRLIQYAFNNFQFLGQQHKNLSFTFSFSFKRHISVHFFHRFILLSSP